MKFSLTLGADSGGCLSVRLLEGGVSSFSPLSSSTRSKIDKFNRADHMIRSKVAKVDMIQAVLYRHEFSWIDAGSTLLFPMQSL